MAEQKKRVSKMERRTPEGMESYLINLAMMRAAEMLEKGTAPSQIISHFLKLGTEKYKYERDKLKADTQLSISKANRLDAQQKSEEVAMKALEAFKRYAGIEEFEEDYDDGDY